MLHALFPESRRFPNANARADAWHRVWRQGGYKRYLTFGRAVIAAGLMLVPCLLYLIAMREGLNPMHWGYVAAVAIPIAVLFVSIVMYWTPTRRALRHELVLNGVPVCIPCGYDLRGSASVACPECGALVADRDSLPPLVVETPISPSLLSHSNGPLPRMARPLGRAVGHFCYRLSRPFERRSRRP